jgi:iron(III) transport system substrate-binding protein
MKAITRSNRLPEALCLVPLILLIAVWPRPALAQAKADWKQKWDKVLSEAKKEGKVVVWGPPGELIRDAMNQGFRKAFPDIAIEYSGARGGEQATRIKAERDGGIFSVDILLSGTTTAIVQMKPMKALDPVEPALILPEVTDLKYWLNNTLEFADEEGKYDLVFVNQLKMPLVYNLSQVKPEDVDSIHKLLDPKWKGKYVVNDPLPSGAGNVTFRWLWRVLGPEKATEYYRKIRANAAVVDRDQRRQIEWVAQGKYAFLVAPSDGVMQQLLQRGLKFGVLPEFKEGTYLTASFGSAMLINKAPHPSAATVFLNWVLSKDGQTAWSKAMEHTSRRLDVPKDHLPPYVIPKPGTKFYTGSPEPGERYWLSHSEENVKRTPEENKILKELFGR